MSQHGCPERLSNRSKGFQEDGGNQPTMELLVETLTGTAFEMTVSPTDTIFAIKSKIFRVEGIPISQQHLLYNLKELEDSSSLREHSISDGARLRLVLGMRGGPISTRRLPPPQNEPWRDIERLLDNNREEGEWGGGGCKVTVLVFRDGERVNMLRVKENTDGTYSPIEHNKYSSQLTQVCEGEGAGSSGAESEAAGGALQNAVTMGKMMELRRRMETLSLSRAPHLTTEKVEIQKTRSEETLSVPSLLDEPALDPFKHRTYTPYSDADDTFAPLYDGNYTRYDYDCAFTDRYTLLPPIGTRTESDQSMHEAVESDRLKLSEALAGSILVKGRRDADADAAILEECLDSEECHLRQDSPQLAAKNLAHIPAAEYGPLVCGAGWVRGGGSHSASSLAGRARAPRPRRHPPLSSALFSSSTSDLDSFRNSSRILPALSRHRNREHLHLSDEGLELSGRHLEVGSERRQRRIHNISEAETMMRYDQRQPDPFDKSDQKLQLRTSLTFKFDEKDHEIKDLYDQSKDRFEVDDLSKEFDRELTSNLLRLEPAEDDKITEAEKPVKEKKVRVRCGFCRKRLSIATVHGCRCGGEYCAPHRYAEVHGCAYDYKADAARSLSRDNPRVSATKLPKI